MQVNKLKKVAQVSLIALSAVAVSACGGGGKNKQAYDDQGRERISILSGAQALSADNAISTLAVALPKPYTNYNWAQMGGNAQHVAQHLSLASNISLAWTAKIGHGDDKYERMVSGPVSGNGLVFAVDSKGQVTAVSLSSGTVQWSTELKGEERSNVGFGGGAALYGDTLFVTSGYGFVVALDASTGTEQWRYEGIVPFRGAPTAAADKVFAVTHDNLMVALDAQTGDLLWDQVGISENAGMLGAASPAYDGTTLVTALSSGELIAMLGTNGRILWQDALSSSRRLTPLSTLADIDGNPVIDRGRVYAVSHAGRMVAIDMRTGERSWEADIAGVNTPWIAGRFGYVTTVDGQLACVSLDDGRVRWVTQMQRFTNQEKRKGLISWNGPVLAGDRLLVTSSHGYILSVSPYTGDVLSGAEMKSGSTTAPIVVDNTFIVLGNNGELMAYK